MSDYLTRATNVRKTPQSEPIPGKAQVANNAGGYVFGIDKWTQLDRFLILGSEGGSYYASERQMTLENVGNVRACIAEDGVRVVDRVLEIGESGRAPKNDPALFALAMCTVGTFTQDDRAIRRAYNVLPCVARTASHLMQFNMYRQNLGGGWGRGIRSAHTHWYNDKGVEALAYQTIKYRSRSGWTHRDLLRLAHVKPEDRGHEALYGYLVGKGLPEEAALDERFRQVVAFERAQTAETEREIVRLVEEFGLTWEMVPNKWLNSRAIWEALLPKMPMTATIRNLGKMTSIGLIAPLSSATRMVEERISNQDWLIKAKVHPLTVLTALKVYASGRGIKGSLSWTPEARIVDALDEAFYKAFGNVDPSGKRTILALDVSGSMHAGQIVGSPLTPAEASCALAMVTARTEKEYTITAFSHKYVPVSISPRERLDDLLFKTQHMGFGGTDCSIPMIDALEKKIEVDAFVVLTDNETWAGQIHPVQALQQYRQKMGIDAKLIVVGMTATGFSIADPRDRGMLDVVGFSSDVPQVISGFISGKWA